MNKRNKSIENFYEESEKLTDGFVESLSYSQIGVFLSLLCSKTIIKHQCDLKDFMIMLTESVYILLEDEKT